MFANNEIKLTKLTKIILTNFKDTKAMPPYFASELLADAREYGLDKIYTIKGNTLIVHEKNSALSDELYNSADEDEFLSKKEHKAILNLANIFYPEENQAA